MHFVHSFIILLSVFGGLFYDYLGFYLVFQLLILCSWVGYGCYNKKWGHCVVTEAQWNLKQAYHVRPDTESYVHYLLKYKFGIETKESTLGMYIFAIYAVTVVIGLVRYFRLLD